MKPGSGLFKAVSSVPGTVSRPWYVLCSYLLTDWMAAGTRSSCPGQTIGLDVDTLPKLASQISSPETCF